MSERTRAVRRSCLDALFTRLAGICLAAALALGFTSTSSAAIINKKISGSIIPLGDVVNFQISPDSQRVVFKADRDTDEVYELYSVPLHGGEPVKLNGPLVSGGDIQQDGYKISAYTQRVVYLADQEEDEKVELYSVPITGGSSTKLNGTLLPDRDVDSMAISPDGQTVVYLADQDDSGMFELYSVPIIGGTAPVKLSKPIPVGSQVDDDFLISSNNLKAVYKIKNSSTDTMELNSVPLGGGASAILNPPLVAGRSITDFKITPNGLVVVYMSDPDRLGKFEVYSFSITGTGVGPIKLSAVGPDTGEVSDFAITPDNLKVVYTANQDSASIRDLYSNSIFGSNLHKLSGTLPDGFVVRDFKITPNSLGVVYTAGYPTIDNVYELYSNYLTGAGGPYKLNPSLAERGGVDEYAITPNNARVIYRADQEVYQRREVYSAPILGGTTPIKLNRPVSSFGVNKFLMIPNGAGVVYTGTQDSPDQTELYSNNNLGTAPLKLSGPMVINGDVSTLERSFEVSPDSRAVVYIADQDFNDRQELYVSYQEYRVNLPLLFR